MDFFVDDTVLVTAPDGTILSGRVTASSFTGKLLAATVELDGTPAVAPPVGELLEVELISKAVPSSSEFGSITELSCDADRALARVEIHVRKGTALSGYLNRRQDVRIAPSAEAPVEVSLRAAGGPQIHRATALDVSMRGVAFELDAEAAASLDPERDVMLALRLPDRPTPVLVKATIRSQRPKGTRVLLGMEFVDDVSTTSSEAVLRQYVMGRQRELLARRAKTG